MRKLIIPVLVAIALGFYCAAGAYELAVAPAIAKPGKCFSVTLVSPEGGTAAAAEFLGQRYALFPSGNGLKAIIGVPLEQRPGDQAVTVTVNKQWGRSEQITRPVTIGFYKYPVTSFWLKPAKKKLLTSTNLIADEWGRIEKKLIVEDPVQRWQGKFLLPVSGEVSMLFGTREFVNRQPRGQHRGLDLAVPTGTKVRAANAGKVVFAEKLKAFGGTIIVDHGQGIHTLYFHLTKFLAEVGQEVSKGETLALSGNTGISSGPHLHWGMSAHNLRVDPAQWTKNAF